MSYAAKLQEEIAHYQNVENVNDLPPIYHYWAGKHLLPKCQGLGFTTPEDLFARTIAKSASLGARRPFRVLSIGAGNCDVEVQVACDLLGKGFTGIEFTCLDVNPQMLARGRRLADTYGVSQLFEFQEVDVNKARFGGQYVVVMASQSLHHIVQLEHLFDGVFDSLADDGLFLVHDMIGRNGHMRWPEALQLVEALWVLLEDRYKYNHLLNRLEPHYVNWDCSVGGFEGVRSQDILRLLLERFGFRLFLGFANVISPFVERCFGPNFGVDAAGDRAFVDFVAVMDDYWIETGRVKPTQMMAVLTKSKSSDCRYHRNISPEFAVRRAEGPSRAATSVGRFLAVNTMIETALVGPARRFGLLGLLPGPVKSAIRAAMKR